MIKERLKKLRLDHKLTKVTLGKISGVSHVQIGRYENGLSKPRPETLVKLAKAFGVDPEYFTDKSRFQDSTPFDQHLKRLKSAIKTEEDLIIVMALIDIHGHKNKVTT